MTAALLTALAVLLMYLALLPRMQAVAGARRAGAFALHDAGVERRRQRHLATDDQRPGDRGRRLGRRAPEVVGRWASAAFCMLWARPHAALIVAVVGLVLAWRERRHRHRAARRPPRRRGPRPAARCWTHWMYGSWNPTGSTAPAASPMCTRASFSVTNQLGMWVSPDRGILVLTPVLLVLLPALVRSWRSLPDWSTALLVGGLAYTRAAECADRLHRRRPHLRLPLRPGVPGLRDTGVRPGRAVRRAGGPAACWPRCWRCSSW